MLWFCLTLGLAAVADAAAGQQAAGPEHVWVAGRLEAAEAEAVRVPVGGVEAADWSPPGGKVRLTWIARDGGNVAAGDQLARFAVPARRLRASLEHRLELARAGKDRALAALDEELGDLRARGELARMEQQKARLDLEKKKAVLARRDLKLAELAVRRATFACDAIGKRIQAFERVRAALEALHDERVRQREQALAYLDQDLARFRPSAPRAGTVRLRALGTGSFGLRRPRPGDWLRPGSRVLTLVSGGRMEVVFALPEGDFGLVSLGGKVRIGLPGGDRNATATITSVAGVPARSRGTQAGAFRIVAALDASSDGFSIGLPVEIGLAAAGHVRAAVPEGSVQGVLASKRILSLYVPALPGTDELTALSLPVAGTPVARGRPVVVFDPGPVRHLLREREDALALARARLERHERAIEAGRVRRELAVEEQEFAVERARLLSVKGVGLTPAIQLDKARLDRRMAELRLRLAREALAGFASRAEAGLRLERLEVESCEREVDEARRALSGLAVCAPRAGLLMRPAMDPRTAGSAVVRPGQRLVDLVDPTRLEARFAPGAGWPAGLGPGSRVTVRCLAWPDLALDGVVRGVLPAGDEPVWRVDIGKGDPRLVPGLTVYLEPAS